MMSPGPESQEYAQRLDERAERMRARLREQPGFMEMIERSQEAEADGRLLSLEEIRKRFEIAD